MAAIVGVSDLSHLNAVEWMMAGQLRLLSDLSAGSNSFRCDSIHTLFLPEELLIICSMVITIGRLSYK